MRQYFKCCCREVVVTCTNFVGPCFDLRAAIFFKILYIIVFVLQSNVSSWTPLYYRQFVSSQKCPKSYIPYLYNTDTSVKRTLGSVPLLSVLKRLDCSHKITKLRAECLLPSVVKNLCGGLIIYEKGNNCRKRHTIYVSLQCLQEHLLQNRVQFISSPWAIYRRVTTNVKVIKTQSEPNPGSFVGSLFISGKLPTYPSPKSTLISSHLGPNVGLGEG